MTRTSSLARRARGAALAFGAALLLGACGGGTSQRDPYIPDQVLAFGDEASTLTADGRKYAINALKADKTLACDQNPSWTQSVAGLYSLVFAQCNPGAVATPGAFMYAAAGARAADLAAQVDAAAASPGFAKRSMATVMMGSNDVLDLYAQYPARSEAELVAELTARGVLVAQQINRLVNADVRVLVSTVPDLGLTPFATAQNAIDPARSALLSRLTVALNSSMRVNIINDGRKLGLVLADEMVQVMKENPGFYGLSNVADAACTAALPDCNDDTLVQGANSTTHLWADATRIGFMAQRQLGLLAQARAANNPF